MKIKLYINNQLKNINIHEGETLLETLRNLGFTSVKYGCGTGDCGACIVLKNNVPVNSCQILTASVSDEKITTVEGISTINKPHIIQIELTKAGAIQCGYCTPAIVLCAYALLKENSNPSIDEIKGAISSNLCRCTGYIKIIEGIQNAAKLYSNLFQEDN